MERIGSASPDELRRKLLAPEIIIPPAVFLASDEGRGITGRRIAASEWSLKNPAGTPAAGGIGA